MFNLYRNIMKTKPFSILDLKGEIIRHFAQNFHPSFDNHFTGNIRVNGINVEYIVYLHLPSDIDTDFEVFSVRVIVHKTSYNINSLCEILTNWIKSPMLSHFELEAPKTPEFNNNQLN